MSDDGLLGKVIEPVGNTEWSNELLHDRLRRLAAGLKPEPEQIGHGSVYTGFRSVDIGAMEEFVVRLGVAESLIGMGRRKSSYRPKKCLYCKKKFIPTGGRQIFCKHHKRISDERVRKLLNYQLRR